MDFGQILNILLPIVYIVVGVALVWFVVELALTFRKTRQTVTEVQKQLAPTLDHVEKITAQLEPVSAKVDPLVDRVSLTVDAANLEIMRVDQILEDVSQITDSVTKTVDTVDSVASAPLDLVNSVTDKVRARFKRRGASEESVRLGSAGAPAEKASAVRDFVDATADAASATIAEQRQRRAERKAEEGAREAAAAAKGEKITAAATATFDAAVTNATAASARSQNAAGAGYATVDEGAEGSAASHV